MSHTKTPFPKRPRLSEPTLPNRNPHHNNQLCSQFQRGSCDYGDRCCFAHGIAVVDDNTKNVRGGEKTKLCWRFMSGEKCVYGDKCHFIHLRCQTTKSAAAAAAAISVLPWRTKLCNKWMETGCCKYGTNCCFAHGQSELQNQGLSDAQDYVEGGLSKLADKNMEGKGLKFKWKSNERISRVYADWINDMPLESQCI